jgi:predicted DNA-binding antitoxin AbrB/MazE fold protein
MILKGKKALLLAEGCKIKKNMKAEEKRLAEIKKEMNIKKDGNYSNEAGDTLNVAKSENFTDIEPRKLLDYLKKNGLSRRFFSLVKVQITETRKVVPESIMDKMRSKLDPTFRWTFK